MQAISGALQMGRRYNPSIGEMGILCFGAHDCHHVRTSVRTVVVRGSARGGWEDFWFMFVADAVSAAGLLLLGR